MDELKNTILEYVKKEYLPEGDQREIREDTSLINSGLVDSFSMVSLKVFLEKRYKIRIPDGEATADAFDTVTSIASLVARLTAGR